MATGLYPGSFDPVTKGHLDIIDRASRIADRLVVAVLENSAKNALFTVDERVEMLKEAVKDYPNVEVRSFSGLTVQFAKSCGATFMVRGLRAVTDFDYELQMAQTNKVLNGGLDTVFLATSLKYAYLSSSIVKEVARYGGDISSFVPDFVSERIFKKMKK